MALEKDVNSYVSLEDAEEYFEDRLDIAAWTEASNEEKLTALTTATMMLDQLTYSGEAISDDQPLAFPRTGSYYDPRLGKNSEMDGAVARRRINNATCELAYHLLNNDGLLDSGGSVFNLNVGAIALTQIIEAPKIPTFIRNGINCLLVSGGRSTWWRAN